MLEINFNSGWTILGLIVGYIVAMKAVKKLNSKKN